MSLGINKVVIVGNLGHDLEVRHTTSGSAETNISVATSEQWKAKNTDEDVVKTEWRRSVFFDHLSVITNQYLKRGSQVYIEGKLQTRKWQDQNNQDRYTTEIIANEMQMLGSQDGNHEPKELSRPPPLKPVPSSISINNPTPELILMTYPSKKPKNNSLFEIYLFRLME